MPLASSTVMTPSLPTLSMASAISLPIVWSLLAEMVPTWAISFLPLIGLEIFLSSSTTASTALSMPRLSAIGLAPAATFRRPSPKMASAQDGGGGGAVAGDVGGLGGDFLHHLGAHVLVGVFELDFLGDGDAVLGDGGRAELLVEDDVAALGAEGDLDGVGELVHALEQGLAGIISDKNLFAAMVSPCFSMTPRISSSRMMTYFDAVDLHFRTAVLADQDTVTLLDVERRWSSRHR